MNKRTKMLDIDDKTRKIVLERDNHKCIFCNKNHSLTMAHVVPRSQGGLGIEQNIVTACSICHYKMDMTTDRKYMIEYAKKHLRKHYSHISDVVYKKDWQ